MPADEIRNALTQLDHDADGDWTADGAPSLSRLGDILGRSVRRGDVTAAAPKFRKGSPELPSDAEEGDPADATGDRPAKTQPDLDAEADAAVKEMEDDPELAALRKAESLVREAAVAKEEADKALSAAQRDLDRRLEERAAQGEDPHATTREIQLYLQRQMAMREQRAETAQAMRGAGLSKALFETRSQIDAAMARRRGFGQNRPQR